MHFIAIEYTFRIHLTFCRGRQLFMQLGSRKEGILGTEGLLSTEQVSERLGLSINTQYFWANAERMPHYRLGGNVRFSWAEVQAWFERNPREVA
jgi:excisionase family DNA binding protein